MNPISCIYRITSPTGKIYIGKTINLHKRMLAYKNRLAERQPALYNSFLKYGVNSHRFDILQKAPVNELALLEIIYISRYESIQKGLNIHIGGEGGCINVLSYPNLMQKLRDRKGSKNPNFGNHFKHSEQAKANMRKRRPSVLMGDNPRALKVKCLNTGMVYDCQKALIKEFGFSRSLVTNIMRKRNGEYNGLKFINV